ncbi:recombinase family protein [Alicyclobacillus macrosporangiidus]|uniref:Site-specific DNA recombinase n=1 Tax=Alicyclobacillus macrosporangiidus TaxID=392015 RepID=A0A1I7IAK5_9BACL|nr:recombinase family protein [Alicyclobacillus macrosporangiidus]SFU69904.1 site-specific DNA recombinase [Alicyclobacillus macrosporangiidus]
MTVALYCRVSTDEQATHGFSLEAQKDRLIAYCQSQGWQDYEVYSDDGYSGTNLERPALRRLIRHIESGLIQSVVVYRLDRLSRRQRHVLYLLEEVFERHGVAFKSATEPFDTSTPLGKAMIGILAVFAQLERETIIERTKEGHHKRARQGLWGGGPQPFGYRWNKEAGRLEVVPSEARIVREMFRRFLQGASLVEIADWAESQYPNRWWDHNVAKAMLQRPIYAGHVHYGTAKAKGNHEPIIDEVTFQSAQREMKRRDGLLPARGEYLLSGLLRCGECGEPVVHHHVHRTRGIPKVHDYYVCARKHKGSGYRKLGGPCPSRHIPMDPLDDQVTQLVRSIATSPEDLISQADEPEAEYEIAALEAELASVERKLRRWYDAFEEEAIDARELRRRVADLERERGRIELALDEARERMRRPDPEPILDAFHAIRDAWDDMELSEKKTVLRATIRQILVFRDGSFRIEWNL